MKIILDDIIYKGHHFKRYECELPNVKNIDDTNEERITEYVKESLDNFLEEES
jgi:hypothetical protein